LCQTEDFLTVLARFNVVAPKWHCRSVENKVIL